MESLTARRRVVLASWTPPLVTMLLLGVTAIYRPYWQDEMSTWVYAERSFQSLVTTATSNDVVHLPYYLLAWPFIHLADSFALVRAISIAAAIGSVILVGWLARRWWGLGAGFVAGLALALNGAFAWQGMQARPYALATFFSLLATVLIVRAAERPARLVWLTYTLVMVAALYAHLLAATILPVHLMLALRLRQLRKFSVAAAIIGVGAAPLVFLGLRQSSMLDWIQPPTIWTVVTTTFGVSGFAFGLLLIGALGIAVRHARQFSQVDEHFVFAVSLTVIPPLELLAISAVAQPAFYFRYLYLLPVGVALVVGYAASLLWQQWARTREPNDRRYRTAMVAAFGVLALSANTLAILLFVPSIPDDFRALSSQLSTIVKPGQNVTFSDEAFAAGIAQYSGDDRGALEVVNQSAAVWRITSAAPLRLAPTDHPGSTTWYVGRKIDGWKATPLSALTSDGCQPIGDLPVNAMTQVVELTCRPPR